jgi:hypothetical protein
MSFQSDVMKCFSRDLPEHECIRAVYLACIHHIHKCRENAMGQSHENAMENDNLSVRLNHTIQKFNTLVEKNKPLVDPIEVLTRIVSREEAKHQLTDISTSPTHANSLHTVTVSAEPSPAVTVRKPRKRRGKKEVVAQPKQDVVVSPLKQDVVVSPLKQDVVVSPLKQVTIKDKFEANLKKTFETEKNVVVQNIIYVSDEDEVLIDNLKDEFRV